MFFLQISEKLQNFPNVIHFFIMDQSKMFINCGALTGAIIKIMEKIIFRKKVKLNSIEIKGMWKCLFYSDDMRETQAEVMSNSKEKS